MNSQRRENATDFTVDGLRAFKNLTLLSPEEVRYADKMNTVLKFLKMKRDSPYLKKQELCDAIGISDSTFKRICKDLGIGSFYRHKVRINKSQTEALDEIDQILKKLTNPKLKFIDEKKTVIFKILNEGKTGDDIKENYSGEQIRTF